MKEIIVLGQWCQETMYQGTYLINEAIEEDEILKEWDIYKLGRSSPNIHKFFKEIYNVELLEKQPIYLEL